MKLVIVGGVAGGASAAARARRLDESAEIILLERGPDVSFANCGMPYYIGQQIVDRKKLLVVTPERLRERLNLDVRPQTEAIAIDRAKKQLRLRNLANDEEYDLTYDKLILAPGASPFRPAVPGFDLPRVMTLRNLSDMDRIAAASSAAKHVVVMGAGFIGLEMIENLVHRGISCTLVQNQSQVLSPLDAEMTTPLAEELVKRGVDLALSDSATSIKTVESTGRMRVQLQSGREVETDLVVVGIGVRPENQLAIAAGLALGDRGGIAVNEAMQTSDPDIYAVGDVVETRDVVSGVKQLMPLAGPANRQGRIAADHLFGRPAKFRGTQATAIVGLWKLTAAMTGLSEKVCRLRNIPFSAVYIHPAHHATYYPGAEPMSLKVLFDPTSGRILGAQGVGGAGVDKRIDILSIAIQSKMTVFDLEEAELCYAPQFGSAKDPINMVGFVAAGMLRGDHPQIDVRELLAMDSSVRPLVLDVRTSEEFAAGHLPGAISISVDQLRGRLSELDPTRKIAAYCQVGQRGYFATRILLQHGFDVVNVSGGYKTYLLHFPAGYSANAS